MSYVVSKSNCSSWGKLPPWDRSRIHAVDGLRCRWFHGRMIAPPDLRKLTEAEKDALILALWAQVQTLTARVAELEARLNQPPKAPSNSSLPPSKTTRRTDRRRASAPDHARAAWA